MNSSKNSIKLAWFGHCCFLIEMGGLKILIDPYDTYGGNDIDRIEADCLVSSSTWHDHGHIGASPRAHIFSYPGQYQKRKVKIVGIKSEEYRGTPNVIFNIRHSIFSLTNFADLGDPNSVDKISPEEKAILGQTNIAFMRHNITSTRNLYCYDLALKLCNPQIIIPIHYHPKSYVLEQLPKDKQAGYLQKLPEVEKMIKKLKAYERREVDSYECSLNSNDLKRKAILVFSKTHPQVKYTG